MTRPGRRMPAWAAAALTAMLGLLATAPGASAGVLTDAVGSCDGQVASKVFSPWLDYADYVKVPNGDFSSGSAGWNLEGARIVDDTEPFGLNGSGSSGALQVADGERATSPAMCVTLVHPTMRMVVRNVGASSGALTVHVLYEDLLGRVRSAPIGVVTGASQWAPTLPMALVVNLLALLPGGNTPVAFRFVPQGDGSEWRIDGVHVDPYCKG